MRFEYESTQFDEDDDEEEEEEEEDGCDDDGVAAAFMKTPDVGRRRKSHRRRPGFSNENPFLAALRKSLLVSCSVDRDDVAANMDIGWPIEVSHVAHVTFDRVNGSFLGLPSELQPEVPIGVPSASASVFGVSAQSMQCSFDSRGNSVPTILLRMQHHLYSEGGLQTEGIFRITGENGQEKDIRNQLNTGVVPHGIDVHCIAGLIKAWFRELPTGVLDSLTPQQVMHCNTEEECVRLVDLLPHTEAALLDWAINLMVDVVQYECQNKMNARNIAMVFAPNMTQMADPLTALIHAVQVMNFLKTLIHKTLRERESANSGPLTLTRVDPHNIKKDGPSLNSIGVELNEKAFDIFTNETPVSHNLSRSATLDRPESDKRGKFWSLKSKSDIREKQRSASSTTTPPVMQKQTSLEDGVKQGYNNDEDEGILNRLSLRKGVERLCRHPIFQLSKPVKKSRESQQCIY